MAMFVHLTSEKNVNLIRRSGIRVRRSAVPEWRVLFAMPVTQNYFISNQWLRELKRSGQRTIVAVHFRIPDDQPVLVGRYGTEHQTVSAAQAVAIVAAAGTAEGFEVLVPRKILPSEIHAVRSVNQVAGWRYFPGSHGRAPCGCPYCAAGQIKARRRRDKWDAEQNDGLGSIPLDAV